MALKKVIRRCGHQDGLWHSPLPKWLWNLIHNALGSIRLTVSENIKMLKYSNFHKSPGPVKNPPDDVFKLTITPGERIHTFHLHMLPTNYQYESGWKSPNLCNQKNQSSVVLCLNGNPKTGTLTHLYMLS